MLVSYPGASAADGLGTTAALALRATALRYEHLNEPARTVARHCILDWFGVALAGLDEPLVRILLDQAREEGGNPQAMIVGSGDRLTLSQAALINGALSHAIDYDDVLMPMRGHPTVTILPAILALAEYRGLGGREVVESFVAGVETACRLGLVVNPSHYADGWHATATIGAFASAAAAANLLRLDEKQAAQALGIAGTQAAGLKSSFGTMCKPLHAGRAAAIGLNAAQLAARGFTSNPSIVECEQGFAETQSVRPDYGAVLLEAPGGFHITQTLFKYHASCYLTHSALEAVRQLRRNVRRPVEDIVTIVVSVDPGHLKICNIAEPRTGLETKFSISTMVALALLGEHTSAQTLYSDDIARRTDVVALRRRIRVKTHDAPSHTWSAVEVTFDGGLVETYGSDVGVPETNLDLQGRQLGDKFDALVRPRLGSNSKRLREYLEHIDEVADVSVVMSSTVPTL